jgi:hypothetical protein
MQTVGSRVKKKPHTEAVKSEEEPYAETRGFDRLTHRMVPEQGAGAGGGPGDLKILFGLVRVVRGFILLRISACGTWRSIENGGSEIMENRRTMKKLPYTGKRKSDRRKTALELAAPVLLGRRAKARG